MKDYTQCIRRFVVRIFVFPHSFTTFFLSFSIQKLNTRSGKYSRKGAYTIFAYCSSKKFLRFFAKSCHDSFPDFKNVKCFRHLSYPPFQVLYPNRKAQHRLVLDFSVSPAHFRYCIIERGCKLLWITVTSRTDCRR